ncbi:hypothetical protein NM3141_2211 [Neisseria meningitidis NM3141]|nr:hypothetical protein NM3141_2211 [Neisseria meningitidis NM3141]
MGTAQKARALPPALAAECVLLAGRQGVSKKNHKGEKAPPLQIFTDILPLPWYKLLKPGGAAPARLHEILCGYKKRRQPPKQGREACTLAVRLWYMRSQS